MLSYMIKTKSQRERSKHLWKQTNFEFLFKSKVFGGSGNNESLINRMKGPGKQSALSEWGSTNAGGGAIHPMNEPLKSAPD